MSENSLTINQNQGLDLFNQMAQQTEVAFQEMEYTYPSAYARVLHPSSEVADDHPTGALQISYSREDKVYAQIAAVMPIDIIGTKGEWARSNPTPRNWRTPFTDTDAQEKYGPSLCRSAGHFRPDPVITQNGGRFLTHPDANNREYVKASKGYNSDTMIEVPTSFQIDENTTCHECPFGKAWFTMPDEDGNVSLALGQVCRPVYTGVFYLVGLMGDNGALSKERRTLLQVGMTGQAARTMFVASTRSKSGRNDAEYQQSLGIQQPMEIALANKPYEVGGQKYNANVVVVPELNAMFSFPLLLAGIIHKEEKGKAAIPFAYNPALVVREYLRTSTESDPMQKLQKAIMAAIEDFAGRIKLQDVQHGKRQIAELINATMSTTLNPDSLDLMQDFLQVQAEYHQEVDGLKKGREQLTTPFQPREATAEDEDSNDAPVSTTTAPRAASPEVKAQDALNALNSAGNFNFVADEADEEEVEDEEVEYVEEELSSSEEDVQDNFFNFQFSE